MRKILISLLMASAAMTPAAVYAQDSAAERRAAREQARAERDAARAERSSSREERSSVREERAAQREPAAIERRSNASDRRNAGRNDPAQVQRAPVGGLPTAAERDSRRQQIAQRQAERAEDRAARRAQYAAAREARRNAGPPPVSNTPQPNTQPPPPATNPPSSRPNWNSNWRHNNHYDWYNWRRKNWWLFALGFYSDPFGWGYQPYSVGWRMWPSYYSRNYWLNDPWQFRLPYAPPGTRWVRYYDDAILVDTWNGQVVDVIYDFFW